MILLYVLSAIAICTAYEATEFAKLGDEKDAKAQAENVESLMRQVGELGMLLENYRRVILSGITEASDVCDFIEKLSDNVEGKFPDGNFISSSY
jgi:hypothetical protein